MAKPEFTSNPKVQEIFTDLENYLDFCRSFGYKYDENDLYKDKSFAFRQFTKYKSGKTVKDNWEVDAKIE